jgi:hypothetical protein
MPEKPVEIQTKPVEIQTKPVEIQKKPVEIRDEVRRNIDFLPVHPEAILSQTPIVVGEKGKSEVDYVERYPTQNVRKNDYD